MEQESINMNKLLSMQRELMEQVPHTIRPDVFSLMIKGITIIDGVLRYLGACGHKPWRPIPLSLYTRDKLMTDLRLEFNRFEALHLLSAEERTVPVDEPMARKIISSLGTIEETVEYLEAVGVESRKAQLEEITDILFFYLEQVILGGFAWSEIEQEYIRKHSINLERYKRAKKNDYTWDKRREGRL